MPGIVPCHRPEVGRIVGCFAIIRPSDTASPSEALQWISEGEQFDVALLDMKMPEMGGMDLFQEAQKSFPDLPVIFLTAYGTEKANNCIYRWL